MISLRELQWVVPRVMVYSAAGYLGARIAKMGTNQMVKLLFGESKPSKDTQE